MTPAAKLISSIEGGDSPELVLAHMQAWAESLGGTAYLPYLSEAAAAIYMLALVERRKELTGVIQVEMHGGLNNSVGRSGSPEGQR